MHLSSTANEDSLHHYDRIVRSCNFLVRHQKRSQILEKATEGLQPTILFPINWTVAHIVFAISLSIPMPNKWTQTHEIAESTRLALVLLALLEGDPNMLSTGFSEILEKIWFNNTK